MKILLNSLAVMLIGWPALIIGYVSAAIKSGFLTGAYLYEKHEECAIDRFVRKVKVEIPEGGKHGNQTPKTT